MWHKTVRPSLFKEKIEADVPMPFFVSFGHRKSVLLRGNPHRKVMGESSHVHRYLAPTILPPFVEREVPFHSSFLCRLIHSGSTALVGGCTGGR